MTALERVGLACGLWLDTQLTGSLVPNESPSTQQLRALLQARRVAALGTVGDDGASFVSMVPYALEASLGSLVIHVSGFAVHTANLQARPKVSILVMESEVAGEPVHALPRVTLECEARALEPDSAAWQAGRAAYLHRLPEAAYMTQLGNFMFFALQVNSARQVAGFGAARSIGAQDIRQALGPAP